MATMTRRFDSTTIAALTANLAENETCPVCRDGFLILCPSDLHMVVTDADGWCAHCDSPGLGEVSCPCQDQTATPAGLPREGARITWQVGATGISSSAG